MIPSRSALIVPSSAAMLLAQPPVAVTKTMDHGHSMHKASDKRRAQNRAAQKTYREKKKRRLEELEVLAASAGLLDDKDNKSPSQQQRPQAHPRQGQQSHSPSSDSGSSTLTNSPLEYTMPLSQHTSQDSARSHDNMQAAAGMPEKFQEVAPRIFGLDDLVVDPLEDDLSEAVFQWPAATQCLTEAPMVQTHDSSMSDSSGTSPASSDCIAAMQQADATSKALTTRNLAPMALQFFAPGTGPSQPISFETTATYSAYLRVAAHLGVDVTDHNVKTADSGFYTPNTLESGDQDNLVRLVQDQFKHLKPDLRPTRSQILIKHPVYLDVMPFPELRDRLIEVLMHDPPVFDEEQFCNDITNGGIVCWGAVGPEGMATGGGGAPWDHRSWEAKTWFINKWNWLIADDSLLARSSEWWREMHGQQEDMSISAFY